MHNKVVPSVLHNVLDTHQKSLTSKTDFKSLGASAVELNGYCLKRSEDLRCNFPTFYSRATQRSKTFSRPWYYTIAKTLFLPPPLR